SATIPDRIKAGQPLPIDLALTNVGYSAPYNPRTVQLILRNTASGAIHSITVEADARRLSPGSHRLRHTLQLPAEVKAGRYELLLNLPDGYQSLAQNPAYSIRLANTEIWEAQTGYNKLKHTLFVGP
ncbi:MAG: DUF4832 domain-containing protein, partial [Cytophagaceae bacterium]